MKKLLEISLGVVTSIGGFLEAGSLATAVQAGAAHRFHLIWAIVLGVLCLIFLLEMAGRFSAVTGRPIADAIRERFGFNVFFVLLIGILLVNFMVLTAEIGGVALALQFLTGWSFQYWAIPVALLTWLLLWKGTFAVIEKGVSFLGLITLCFVLAAILLHPPWKDVMAGAMPNLPDSKPAQYWFMAVNILGASISPYLFLFYSSGAVEDKWDDSYVGVNRAIASIGTSFGGVVAASALIVAAMVFLPRGITEIDSYEQVTPILTTVFGYWGFILFCASLGIACFGAALEIGLCQGYLVAQGFGWTWGEDLPPKRDPGFSLTYTVFVVIAGILIATGLDPLKLTLYSMSLTAMTLPLSVVPFLFLMNDERYVGKYCNGWISNLAVILIIGLGFLLSLVTLPLQVFGGS